MLSDHAIGMHRFTGTYEFSACILKSKNDVTGISFLSQDYKKADKADSPYNSQ